jgi:MraZ protein
MLTNFDGCVRGYPLQVWEEIEQSFDNINGIDTTVRDFHRYFIAGALEVEMDKQGRILIPPSLRSSANLEREVVLAGVGNKFEIWDMARFEEKQRYVEEHFDDIMDKLASAGFELRI